MGRLSGYQDMTGALSQSEVNARNIEMIIEELNRNGEQLDSLTQNLSIIARGSATASGTTGSVTGTFSANVAFTFLAFYAKDGDSNLYPVPNTVYNSGGTLLTSVFAYSTASPLGVSDASIVFQYFNTVPANWTFYYYVLRQPAQVTLQ